VKISWFGAKDSSRGMYILFLVTTFLDAMHKLCCCNPTCWNRPKLSSSPKSVTVTHYSYHDIFAINAIHGSPPAECLSALAAYRNLTVPSPCNDFVVLPCADFAVHPNSLQDL
jgi:hypothetical protein